MKSDIVRKPKLTTIELSKLKDGDHFMFAQESQVYGQELDWVTATVEIDEGRMLIYELNGGIGESEDYPEIVFKIG